LYLDLFSVLLEWTQNAIRYPYRTFIAYLGCRFPYKKSNSQLTVETIFEKHTYNRLRNHKKMHNDYLKKL